MGFSYIIYIENNSDVTLCDLTFSVELTGTLPSGCRNPTVAFIYVINASLRLIGTTGFIISKGSISSGSNGSFYFLYAYNGGKIFLDSSSTTSDKNAIIFNTSIAFSLFAYSQGIGSMIEIGISRSNTFTFTNASNVTGKRYSCTNGGTINVNNKGVNFFPGNTAGTVESSTYSWYK